MCDRRVLYNMQVFEAGGTSTYVDIFPSAYGYELSDTGS